MAGAVMRGTWVLWLLLVIAHVATQLTWRFRYSVPEDLRPLLNMSDEQSLLTWLTVCMGFVLGVSCLLAWRLTQQLGWLAVGALFLYISFDDATMLHERIGWMIERKEGYGDVYRWVQWIGPVYGLAGIAAFSFLWKVFRGNIDSRRRVFAAFACLGMALVFEVFEHPLHESSMGWRGFSIERYTILIEESLELLAPAILFSAIGGFFEKRYLESYRQHAGASDD